MSFSENLLKEVLKIAAEEPSFKERLNTMLQESDAVKVAKKDEGKWIQKAVKKPGALREHYGVKEGEDIPVEKAKADFKKLEEKAEKGNLSDSERKLHQRLNFYFNVTGKKASQEEDSHLREAIVRLAFYLPEKREKLLSLLR